MDSVILVIVLIVVVAGFGVLIAVLNGRLRELKNGNAVELMKADVTELSRSIAGLQQTMGDKLERSSAAVQT